AAGIVEFLEAVEDVTAVTHRFAGLADVAELLGQLQQPDLGADDFLFLGHNQCPLETPRPGATQPRPAPRPASAPASAMTPIDRGRDARYRAPPAQIRTCGIPAYGFHLGFLTANRVCGQG